MATIKLYINTDRGDISRAFVKSTSEPTTESHVPALVAGNKRNVEVYLIDSAGNYDARSGASNYALSIGAGPLAGTPSSGTFTLTDGTETTTALAHNASAQVVEDALNALNSSAGPFSKLVDVTSTYDGNYLVKFRTTGAVAALAGDASELSPQSAVVVDEARAGDGSTKEQQFIRLLRQPAIFQDSFTQIANGWSGELSANNARVLELMVGRDTIAIPLDVELTETGNEPETIARGNMLLSNEVINPASIDPGNLAQLLTEALGDARYLRTTNNFSDVTNAATARSNIGAAAAADLTAHTGSTSNPHSVTAAQVGLGNVDNTSDADKPVSTAQQTALDLKANATALTTETNARIDADNRRELAGGVYCDGNDLGRITTAVTLDQISSNPFTLYFKGRIDESTKNAHGNNIIGNAKGIGSYAAGNFGLVYRNATTDIRFESEISSSSVVATEVISINTNEELELLCTVDPSTERVIIYKNGIEEVNEIVTGLDLSAAGTVNIFGNRENSIPETYPHIIGVARSAAIFNTALSATQAADLYQQGLQPWLAANPEYRRGYEVYQSDFSSGTDDWGGSGDEDGVTVSQSSAGIGGQSNTIIATLDSSIGVHAFWDDLDRYNGTGLFKIKFDVYIPSNQNIINGVQVLVSSEGSNSFQPVLNPTLDSWNTYESNTFKRTTADSNRINFYLTDDNERVFTGNETDFVHFKNIEITQVGSLATLPLDDDCRQLKDISGNRNDATASESGVTHLKQKDLHAFRDDHADGTGGSYLIANADILAENEVITGVTVDGRFHAASGDQDLTKRRIKLEDHGSHVDVMRSNGTTDDSAIAITNPSDGTDFAITVLTQRI